MQELPVDTEISEPWQATYKPLANHLPTLLRAGEREAAPAAPGLPAAPCRAPGPPSPVAAARPASSKAGLSALAPLVVGSQAGLSVLLSRGAAACPCPPVVLCSSRMTCNGVSVTVLQGPLATLTFD